MFSGPLNESLLKKAQSTGLLKINVHDIRDYTEDKHKTADDSPYGGVVGMVMKIEPIASAIAKLKIKSEKLKIILLTPAGETLTQSKVIELSKEEHLIIICGHYEGIDERIQALVTDEISIGDYVLTGGEPAAMVLIDAVARQIPGVVGDEQSLKEESFYEGLLDFPHYTRPEDFKGHKVPEVLISGHHEEIRKWRRKESLKRTLLRRPELLARAQLTAEDKELLKEIITG